MKFSKFISYFFHPINFSIIGTILYFLLIPEYIFKPQEHLIIGVILLVSYVFPLLLSIFLKLFKLIDSYHMVTVEERKFPTLLFISISLFLGQWLLSSNIVDILSILYFGYGLALICTYIFLFFKIKISLHTSAIGGLIGFFIYFSSYYELNLTILIAALFLLSGIIAYARLRLKAHSLIEVTSGFVVGLLSQFILYSIYIM